MACKLTHFLVRSEVLKDLATIRAALPSGGHSDYPASLLIQVAVEYLAASVTPQTPPAVGLTLTRIRELKEATRTRKVEAARRRFHPVPGVEPLQAPSVGQASTPPKCRVKVKIRPAQTHANYHTP